MRKAVFVIGVYDRVAEEGVEPLSASSVAMLEGLAQRFDLEVLPVVACPLQAAAGLEKVASLKWIRHFRPNVVKKINDFDPEWVFCFGKVAASSILNKGSVVLSDTARTVLQMPDVKGKIIVLDSLLRVAAQPGIERWLGLNMQAAFDGYTDTKWGEYTVLQPGTPEWNVCPEWLQRELNLGYFVGFDLETYPGLSPWDKGARIRMGMLSVFPGRVVVVQCTPDSEFPGWFHDIMQNEAWCKAGSNIAFDYRWMTRFGYTVNNMWDTAVAEHLIDETNPNKGLKDLTFLYLPRLADYSREHRWLVKQRGGWEHVADDEQYDYAGADGEASVAAAIEQHQILKNLYPDDKTPVPLAMRLYKHLAKMQADGACFDMEENARLQAAFDTHLTVLRQRICAVLGPINPASPQALAKALRANVPGLDLTTGKLLRLLKTDDDLGTVTVEDVPEVSTGKKILKREAAKHPVIALVLEFRKWSKLYGTYVEGPATKHAEAHGGRHFIHASFNQNRVETHRLSSSNPNMQNIPRKPGEDDPPELNVKRQFVSRFDGGSIMEADYSQAELRVAAMLSGDKAMLAALTSGRDVHTETAATLLKKEYEDITKAERQRCKTLNFLIIYGGGANTLAAALGIEKDEAKLLIKQYFKTFPGLKEYIDKVHADVRENLMVESPFGYRRRFRAPDPKPMPDWVEEKDAWKYDRWNQWDGWAVQRQAFNMIVQNAAACYTFLSLCDICEALEAKGMKTLVFGTVHDSILLDVYPGEEKEVAALVKGIMEGQRPACMPGTVPMLVDLEIGPNWGDKKGVEL